MMGYAMSELNFEDIFNQAMEEKIDRCMLDIGITSALLKFIKESPLFNTVLNNYTPEERDDMSFFKGVQFLEQGSELMDSAEFYGSEQYGPPMFESIGLFDCNGQAIRVYIGEQQIHDDCNSTFNRKYTLNGWIMIQLLN